LVGLQEGGLKQTYWEMVGKINAWSHANEIKIQKGNSVFVLIQK
jgi:hypothetical protein